MNFGPLKKKLAEIEAMAVNDPSKIPMLVDGCRMEVGLLEESVSGKIVFSADMSAEELQKMADLVKSTHGIDVTVHGGESEAQKMSALLSSVGGLVAPAPATTGGMVGPKATFDDKNFGTVSVDTTTDGPPVTENRGDAPVPDQPAPPGAEAAPGHHPPKPEKKSK